MIGKIKAHTQRILGLKVNKVGNTIATLGGEESLKFWDIRNVTIKGSKTRRKRSIFLL